MDSIERAQYWIDLEDTLLIGGCTISEWCTFISKSVYDAFVAGANLAVIITAMACLVLLRSSKLYFRLHKQLSSKPYLETKGRLIIFS